MPGPFGIIVSLAQASKSRERNDGLMATRELHPLRVQLPNVYDRSSIVRAPAESDSEIVVSSTT